MSRDVLRKSIVVTCVVVGILSLPFVFVSTSMPMHDFKLWRIEQAFKFMMGHPFRSAVVQRKSYLGTLYQSGDHHCNYFVGEVRTSPLSKDEIARRYAYGDGTLDVLGFVRNIPIQVSFMDEWPSLRLDAPVYQWMEQYLQKSGMTTTKDIAYIVYVADYRGSPWLDYRCWD